MNSTKRVIILDKLNSPNIYQAIFILKDTALNEFCAVDEAERLVREFIDNSYSYKPKARRLSLTVAACVFAALCLTAIIIRQII